MGSLADGFSALDAAVVQLERASESRGPPRLSSADGVVLTQLLTSELPSLEKRISALQEARQRALHDDSHALLALCARVEALGIAKLTAGTREASERAAVEQMLPEGAAAGSLAAAPCTHRGQGRGAREARVVAGATGATGVATAAVGIVPDAVNDTADQGANTFEPISKQMHQRLPRNLRVKAGLDKLNVAYKSLWEDASGYEDYRRSSEEITERLGAETAELLDVLRGVGVIRHVGQPRPGWALVSRSKPKKKNLRSDMGRKR